MPRPAVLMDRDGTLIEERHYLHDPEEVALVEGAGPALRSLAAKGYALVVVTNQSGVARGFFDVAQVMEVHRRLEELLRAEEVRLDGLYLCPHHPDHDGPCACRKPAPGMGEQAARELGLDLARSWVIGDKASDVDFGRALGARSVLVLTGHGEEARAAVDAAVPVVRDLPEAARWILEGR